MNFIHQRFLTAYAALLLLLGNPAGAAEITGQPIFDPSPTHDWNQLYEILGGNEAESAVKVAGIGNQAKLLPREIMAALEAFIKAAPETGAMPPLQKAVMQRQLLTAYNAAAADHGATRSDEAAKQETQKLLAFFGKAIRQVAMSAEHIRALPDNYAAATNSKRAVLEFDKENPLPFLPKDLLEEDGPWIGLELTPQGGRQGVVAEFHFELMKGITSFEVRMKHPEGREAGAEYLKALAKMPRPYLLDRTIESAKLKPNGPDRPPWPNPATPQFPAGTAWALIQRAVLADTSGQPVVSPLVVAVQIRVYQKISYEEAFNSTEFQREVKSLEAEKKEVDFSSIGLQHYQTAFEWSMRGPDLLGNNGFHLAKTRETLFGGNASEQVTVNAICMQCHSAPGIHSINSRSGLFHNGTLTSPPEFQSAPRIRIDEVTVKAAQAMEGWINLRKLWQEN